MLSEIATMKIVHERTTIPVPCIFDFEASAKLKFGYPFVLMEYLGGFTLTNGIAETVPPKYHRKVAEQLARVFVQLQSPTFNRIGRLWRGNDAEQPVDIIPTSWHACPGPLDTSLEFYYGQQQEESRQAMALHPGDPDWQTASWVLKTALAHFIISERIHGPFPLCHLDLHYGNIMFDGEYNLTGIIDWSNAQAAPLEQLAACPEFLIFPAASDEVNKPIIAMKDLVVQFIKHLEQEQQESQSEQAVGETDAPAKPVTRLSTYLASKRADIALRHSLSQPRVYLPDGKSMAMRLYGTAVTWEQLKEVYGAMPLS